jgi:hypothetical protein
MPRGGARPGAGRPKGGKNRKTIERMKIAEQAAAGGITPLELMLQLMRSLWDEGTRSVQNRSGKARDRRRALRASEAYRDRSAHQCRAAGLITAHACTVQP